jgi:thymidylate kinase
MNVRFVGCPNSGKTTVATYAFAKLKEANLPVEFIPEAARLYIAWKRVQNKLQPTDKLEMNDNDQFSILDQQARIERIMSKACGKEVIIISDAWSLSSILYLSESIRKNPTGAQLKAILREHEVPEQDDLVFYCAPVPRSTALDPNRVHSEEEALAIDRLIPEMLKEYAPNVKVIYLEPSTTEIRTTTVLAEIFKHFGVN